MTFFLEKLLPLQKLAAIYPFAETVSNGEPVAFTPDYSGNNRTLTTTDPRPIWSNQLIARKPVRSIYSDGAKKPLVFAGNLTVKEIFCAAKWTGGATFGSEYRGLISDRNNSSRGILAGHPNTTRFTNFNFSALGGFSYRKSGVPYPESNQLAPMGKFELLNWSLSSGFPLDGIQLLQDRTFDARKWIGNIIQPMFLTELSTETERKSIELYYDLVLWLFKQNGTVPRFPDKTMIQMPNVGYQRFYASPLDKKSVTSSIRYADGGDDAIEVSGFGTRTWEIDINCSKPTHAESKAFTDIYDTFNNSVGQAYEFDFLDKYGELHSRVKIEDYDRNHRENLSMNQTVSFKLVKRDATDTGTIVPYVSTTPIEGGSSYGDDIIDGNF